MTLRPPATLADRVDSCVANAYLAGRNLRFEAEEGHVTLKGVVNTYFQKQMAQEGAAPRRWRGHDRERD